MLLAVPVQKRSDFSEICAEAMASGMPRAAVDRIISGQRSPSIMTARSGCQWSRNLFNPGGNIKRHILVDEPATKGVASFGQHCC